MKTGNTKSNKWLRLLVGLGVFAVIFWVAALAPPPPGFFGDMIQRNVDRDIQATALFYMDLDRMVEIQENLQTMQDVHETSNP